jgi:uncharacterized membrane-anchored protein YhcB (DUF1043 family)
MRTSTWPYVVIGLLVVGVAFAVWHRRTTLEQLRADVANQQSAVAERARLRENHRRLLAAQPSDAQMDETATNHALATELRAQLAEVPQRVADNLSAETRATPLEIVSLEGNSVSADRWQNAGRDTPAAALQTALWAAAKGEFGELVASMSFDPEAKLQAHVAFSQLTPSLQRDLGTPERMVALMTAMDVPMGRATIIRNFSNDSGQKLAVRLTDESGENKTSVLSLQSEGGQWRFKVPVSAVTRYAEELASLGRSVGNP